MRTKDHVVAICFSDLHLSLNPPIARSGEKSWLGTMKRTLEEIKDLALRHNGVPILCAGDLFDRWNSPPELINWCLDNLPEIYAIPGNHDIPFHQVQRLSKSAYQTLVQAGKVISLLHRPTWFKTGRESDPFYTLVYGFHFGSECEPEKIGGGRAQVLQLALTHEYVWIKGKSYPGADPSGNLTKRAKVFKKFDTVIIGDNHQGYSATLSDGTNVFNCGTVLRRKSNEVHYRPHVGIVYASGKVKPHYLNISKDVITEIDHETETPENALMSNFLDELASTQSTSIDFREAIDQALKKLKQSEKCKVYSRISKVILEAIGS